MCEHKIAYDALQLASNNVNNADILANNADIPLPSFHCLLAVIALLPSLPSLPLPYLDVVVESGIGASRRGRYNKPASVPRGVEDESSSRLADPPLGQLRHRPRLVCRNHLGDKRSLRG